MPELDHKNRAISFKNEDFQSIENLRTSLAWLMGVMFYPECSCDIENYAYGALFHYIRDSESRPNLWYECAILDKNFARILGTRGKEADECFNACWEKPRRRGHNLYEKGLLAGKFFHLYIPWRRSKAEVYRDIEKHPLLLPNYRSNTPFKESTLKPIWQQLKHSSHFWVAYLSYYHHHNSDFFEDILDGTNGILTAGERMAKVNDFFEVAATAAFVLGEKKNPDAPQTDKDKGKNYETEPADIWTALYNGKVYQRRQTTLVIRSLTLQEAVNHKLLFRADNGGYCCADDPSLSFSIKKNNLTIYKKITPTF